MSRYSDTIGEWSAKAERIKNRLAPVLGRSGTRYTPGTVATMDRALRILLAGEAPAVRQAMGELRRAPFPATPDAFDYAAQAAGASWVQYLERIAPLTDAAAGINARTAVREETAAADIGRAYASAHEATAVGILTGGAAQVKAAGVMVGEGLVAAAGLPLAAVGVGLGLVVLLFVLGRVAAR